MMQTRSGRNNESGDMEETGKQVSETLPTLVNVSCSGSRFDVKSRASISSKSALLVAKLKEKQLIKQLELEAQLRLAKARDEVELAELQAELSDCEIGEPCNESVVEDKGRIMKQFLQDCEEQLPSSIPLDQLEKRERRVTNIRTELPRVELSFFDGEVCNYWKFTKQFEYYVEQRVDDEGQRLLYLMHYCKGRAKDAIEECIMLPPEHAYKKAKSILKDLYGQPHLIARTLINDLLNSKDLTLGDPDGLTKLAIKLQSCELALTQMEYTADINSLLTIERVVRKLPMTLQEQWAIKADTIVQGGQEVKFQDLHLFVADNARVSRSRFGRLAREMERKPMKQFLPPLDTRADIMKQRPRQSFLISGNHRIACWICDQGHQPENCPTFLAMSVPNRLNAVKEKNKCFMCLKGGHRIAVCRYKRNCKHEGCTTMHHILLHPISSDIVKEFNQIGRNICTTMTANEDIRLGIIPVLLEGPNESLKTYAFLDSGSDTTLIRTDVAQRLGLECIPQRLRLNTVTCSKSINSSKCQLRVRPLDERETVEINSAYLVPTLPIQPIRAQGLINMYDWPHLSEVPTETIEHGEVTLLIGCDVPEAHWVLDQRIGGRGCPYAVRTLLGWVVFGPTQKREDTALVHFTGGSVLSLEEQLRLVYDHEFADTDPNARSLSLEDQAALEIVSKNIRVVNGHYEIPLPWRNDTRRPTTNYMMARKRLTYLRKRLLSDDALFRGYANVIQSYIDKGYALRLKDAQPNIRYYLPHHHVIHPRKPGKLRVVFDCAAKHDGLSLNDYLLQGPDTTANLVGVLLRFRKEKIALVADIEEMFLQIRVPERDQGALMFLWWPESDLNAEPVEYQMVVHPFGATSSPFCANYALKRTVYELGASYCEAVTAAIQNHFYVDDCLMSVSNVEEAKLFVDEITGMLQQRGFRLRNWVTNERSVLDAIPASERSKKLVELNYAQLPIERTLGMEWDAEKDCFHFRFQFTTAILTRRSLLSCVSSLFDPLGLVSPLLIPAKYILQRLCRKGLSWDDPVNHDEQEAWERWVINMENLKDIYLPRCLKPSLIDLENKPQLHIFCDASETGYGAVAYVRYLSPSGQGHCQIIMAKARVAPLKFVTIPRLELAAAVLATRVYRIIDKEIGMEFARKLFWTDSTIVLHYIRNTTSRFSTFVANRLSEIHEVTKPNQWRHVSSKNNPADHASRGLNYNLDAFSSWLQGPIFLRDPEALWSKELTIMEVSEEELEYKQCKVHAVTTQRQDCVNMLILYYSDWFKLLKSVAWLTRFKSYLLVMTNVKKNCAVKVNKLTVTELRQAQLDVVRLVQQDCFQNEYKALSSNNSDCVVISSQLRRLCPIMIDGVIRVGGRLQQSKYGENYKHQIILPSRHRITELIVEYHHRLEGHSGVTHVLASIRQLFWILQGPTTVKRIVGKCIKCRRIQAPRARQMMASLPTARVDSGWFPFTYVGVDYFGPFFSKRGRSLEKRYGCIFTCMQCRAVHIEMAHSLTTDSFIMTLMRFVNRRGRPKKMFSDNGTNFVGANTELIRCVKNLDLHHVNDKLVERGIEWHFNPPSASHRGGVWERLIRSIRRILNAIVSDQLMNDEALSTLLTEVERILNNRPLIPLGIDANEPEVLTPNDLLLMRTGDSVVPEVGTEKLYIRRWKQVNHLASVFWKRWTREYLPLLQSRQKWISQHRNFMPNDVVLVASNNLPRGQWSMGIIENCHIDPDGLVRTVELRTSSGTIKRDVRSLCLLEGVEDGVPDKLSSE